MTRRIGVAVSLMFTLQLGVMGQAKSILLADYWRPYRASVEKAKSLRYRQVIVDQNYEKKVLMSIGRSIIENLPPDRARTLRTFVNQHAVITENEVITVGD